MSIDLGLDTRIDGNYHLLSLACSAKFASNSF